MPVPVREFRAGDAPVWRSHPAIVKVSKPPARVRVRFVQEPESVSTREGKIMAQSGDAVLTAATGEQWPVARVEFDRYYAPTGEPGIFESVPRESLALQVDEPFEVVFADGRSRLAGRPGDWLLDHEDGQLGVVSNDIFATSYRRLT